ncbi:unnamed protein product [Musa textilis]
MGNDVVGVVIELQDHYNVKVNSSICLQLTKILDRINSVLPAIESARPGCTSGILVLCSLCKHKKNFNHTSVMRKTLMLGSKSKNNRSFTKFKADSSVEEAGRALLDLLRQTGSSEDV